MQASKVSGENLNYVTLALSKAKWWNFELLAESQIWYPGKIIASSSSLHCGMSQYQHSSGHNWENIYNEFGDNAPGTWQLNILRFNCINLQFNLT